MVSDRTLIVIMLACIGAVGISTAIKINENSFSSHIPLSFATRPVHLEIDPEFLEDVVSKSDVPKAEPVAPVNTVAKPKKIIGVTAESYIIGDTATGEVYLEYNSEKVMPVASMSKLVTAFVATDLISASTTIEITEQAIMAPPDKSFLKQGEQYSRKDIMYPLLLSSSNVAAESISEATGNKADFLEQMKGYSWEIGMPGSFFADPSGVSPQNAATAYDIFALAGYLVNYRPDILAITRIPRKELATTTDHGYHLIESTHPFVNDTRFVGGKTGRTPEAGETMVTIMNIYGRKIAFVVLGSRNRESDTRTLINVIEKALDAAL
ncbi:MAG: D-alanyl-D-alanine carboxypeptidase [Candidatus Pacebacteria bacterium]|nr:D-alanyl-D-alanine carboxypeptidase [Candidatus Paceibacterota bacterium]